MSGFFPALVATFLAEWGDKTQILAMMLALRFQGSRQLLYGLAAAITLNCVIGAVAGYQMGQFLTHRAAMLMTGLALLFGGVGALIPQRPPRLSTDRGQLAWWSSFIAFFAAGLGDKAQFLTMALAAQSTAPALVGAGAAIGIFLANIPAVILGDRLTAHVPLRAIRKAVGLLLLAVGLIVGLLALRLA